MKKALAIFICTLMLAGAVCVPAGAVIKEAETSQCLGDINGDGKINGMDAYVLKCWMSGKDVGCNKVSADINGDGRQNGQDLYYLLCILAGRDVIGDSGCQLQRILIGKTEISAFEITYPAGSNQNVQYAASELQKYIKLARGVELPIVTDSEAEHVILIATDSTGALGDEGVDILVEQGNVYITGGEKRGCMYGVYEFLERFIGWVFINAENEYLNENQAVDIAEGTHYRHIPVIKDRDSQTYSYAPYVYSYDSEGKRVSVYKEENLHAALKLKISSWKNRGALEKSEKYGYSVGYVGTAHSMADYYPGLTNENQICYTNENNYIIVRDNVLAKIEKVLSKGYNCDRISVAPMDNTNYCPCRLCNKKHGDSGTYMGSQLYFVNRIAEAVAEVYPDVHIMTTAYWYARKPPKDIVPADNVDILYCWAGCNNHPFDGSECYEEGNRFWYNNIKENEYFEKWCEITKGKIYCWIYATSYSAMLGQASLLPDMRENIKYLADHGVYGIYCEGYYGTSDIYKDGNCFDNLLMYMFIRCQWDPYMTDEEFDEYIDEYLYAYYGDGWQEVRRLIDMNGEATDAVEQCWCNNCDIVFDCLDMDYYIEHAEEMFALADKALLGAKTEAQTDHLEHFAASVYWMCLAATGEQLTSGTDEQKELYAERYGQLYQWMIKYPIVNLDDGTNKFDPDDPTVMDPYKWCGYSNYHSKKSSKDPMALFD